jgi:hypothetical protein
MSHCRFLKTSGKLIIEANAASCIEVTRKMQSLWPNLYGMQHVSDTKTPAL